MEEQQKNTTNTRKKSHYFETYISKILKQITTSNGITANAKQQLNSFLCSFIKEVVRIVHELTVLSKKKTISVKEIENALNILLFGELLKVAKEEGNKACDNFSSQENKGSRQTKANIIFPPSIVEKFLRNFGYSKFMVASLSPVYLAAVLEYLTFDILDNSVNITKNSKHMRVTVRDMELAVRNDDELNKLFNKLNTTFLGGGVVPYIHSSLMTRKNKKKQPKKDTHRYRYGTMALKNIKKQQKNSDSLILSKSPFEKMVREHLKKYLSDNVKVSKEVFLVLQHFIEQYIINKLYHSNYLTIHANRVKLLPIDIELYHHFSENEKNPYINKDVVNLVSIEENDNDEEMLEEED